MWTELWIACQIIAWNSVLVLVLTRHYDEMKLNGPAQIVFVVSCLGCTITPIHEMLLPLLPKRHWTRRTEPIKIPVTRYIPAAQETPERKPRRSDGYVYLLKSASGEYKIGHTTNPEHRFKTFDVKLPFKVSFEHLILCEDRRALESELHLKFKTKRINGEWFALTDADIEYIKSL